jgi:hypothetical protein
MIQADFVGRIVRELERAQIAYMFVGSHASSFHGYPRTTADIDIVIDPSRPSLDALLARLPADQYYVDPDTAHEAFRRRTQFNVIDQHTGYKADLIIRKQRAFSIEELQRRVKGVVEGVEAYVASVEDTIVSKLEWAKAGESERQLRDVREMMKVHADRLDRAYLDRWITELKLEDVWAKAQS